MLLTTYHKSDDEDGARTAFYREPEMVETRQTAAKYPIPSELKSPKRLPVGVSVQAA